MTLFLLVRHGNTFSSGDKVVWVGARTDLPLTQQGQEQATQLGLRLQALQIKPALIACGPLLRTREHASILKNNLSYLQNIQIMQNLREIDYGSWEGLSSEEIESNGDAEELMQWQAQSTWPISSGWTPSPEVIQKQCDYLLKDLTQKYPNQTVILVSSNGILRFFAEHALNRPDFTHLKMHTGHVSEMQHNGQTGLVLSWNQAPDIFSLHSYQSSLLK